MQYSIIQKLQLESMNRLDAEYYQSEYLEVDKKVSFLKYQTIKKISEKVFSGPFGSTLKSESYQSEGIPFIRIGNISDIFIDKEDEDLVYISPKEHKRIFSTHLKSGDIVFSKIGTIGRLSVISDDFGEVNISENNIGIRFAKLLPEQRVYLLFFLLSKYGQQQILRKASGNIQQKLNVADIETIKVPIVKEKVAHEIFSVYKQVIEFRRKSESLYSQAKNLLLKGLGLEDFKIEDDLSYVVSLSDVKSANRIDAEYFQLKYEKLISKIKNQNAKKLKELAERTKTKIRPKFDEVYKYIEISNINVGNGDIDFNEILGKEQPANARIPIEGKELIVSNVRPTRKAISIIPSDFNDKFICSGAFSVFKVPESLKEYLFVVLRSVVGKITVRKIYNRYFLPNNY